MGITLLSTKTSYVDVEQPQRSIKPEKHFSSLPSLPIKLDVSHQTSSRYVWNPSSRSLPMSTASRSEVPSSARKPASSGIGDDRTLPTEMPTREELKSLPGNGSRSSLPYLNDDQEDNVTTGASSTSGERPYLIRIPPSNMHQPPDHRSKAPLPSVLSRSSSPVNDLARTHRTAHRKPSNIRLNARINPTAYSLPSLPRSSPLVPDVAPPQADVDHHDIPHIPLRVEVIRRASAATSLGRSLPVDVAADTPHVARHTQPSVRAEGVREALGPTSPMLVRGQEEFLRSHSSPRQPPSDRIRLHTPTPNITVEGTRFHHNRVNNHVSIDIPPEKGDRLHVSFPWLRVPGRMAPRSLPPSYPDPSLPPLVPLKHPPSIPRPRNDSYGIRSPSSAASSDAQWSASHRDREPWYPTHQQATPQQYSAGFPHAPFLPSAYPQPAMPFIPWNPYGQVTYSPPAISPFHPGPINISSASFMTPPSMPSTFFPRPAGYTPSLIGTSRNPLYSYPSPKRSNFTWKRFFAPRNKYDDRHTYTPSMNAIPPGGRPILSRPSTSRRDIHKEERRRQKVARRNEREARRSLAHKPHEPRTRREEVRRW